MVNQPDSVVARPSAFGNEVEIKITLPNAIPDKCRIILFRRAGTDVSNSFITSYFANLNQLHTIETDRHYVFDSLPEIKSENAPDHQYVVDVMAQNNTVMYYKAVIYDPTEDEYSNAVSANATPVPAFKTTIIDGKDITVMLLQSLLDNVTDSAGNKYKLNRDVIIKRTPVVDFLDGVKDYFVVQRVNGSEYATILGQEFSNMPQDDYSELGAYYSDVIKVSYVSQEPTRPDKMVKALMASRQILIKAAKRLRATELKIDVVGDEMYQLLSGTLANSAAFVFRYVVPERLRIDKQEYNYIIGELEVNL